MCHLEGKEVSNETMLDELYKQNVLLASEIKRLRKTVKWLRIWLLGNFVFVNIVLVYFNIFK